ncbi:MAG: dethiobiotin synthase [Acidimicrobiia bacterium]|nr:dethiobiotin synthase [Acidimicrobiia bacterium]
MSRPERHRPQFTVLVAGTATEVGKTWVAARLLETARDRGHTVAARKPVQSFDPAEGITDAAVLAAASDETVDEVCPADRSYPLAMAPPIAARELGRTVPTTEKLLDQVRWPPDVELGVVEAVGGVRSPLSADGDTTDLADALRPDLVILVANAGLGTINVVRLCAEALDGHRVVTFLNRFDASDAVARNNREWLHERDGFAVETEMDGLLGWAFGTVS